jgi:nucleoid-associated protein YgaU
VRVDQVGEGGKVIARAEVPFAATASLAAAPSSSSPSSPPPAPAPAPAAVPPPARPAASEIASAPAAAPAPSVSVQPAQPASPEPSPVPAAAAPERSAPPAATASANPVVAELASFAVKRGDNLWRISRRVYGSGVRYSTIYKANTDQIRNPNRIYPGQVFVVPPS